MRKYTTNKEKVDHKKKAYIDYSLVFVVLFLIVFGLIMIYSTTSYESSISEITNKDASFYLKKQMVATFLGLIAMVFVMFFPRKIIYNLSIIIYGVAAAMLFLVITPLGQEVNGARRWLNLGVFTIQPAEVAKLAVIIGVAFFLCKIENGIRGKKAFWFVFFIPIPLCFLTLVFTKDLSSAAIIFLIGFSMLYVVCPNVKWVAAISAAGAGFIGLMVFLVLKFPSFPLWDFRGDRIIAWRDPTSGSDAAYQTLQALYAIGSGGIFGKGIGQSVQKLGVLPEAQNDMVFAVICEELGLFGGICILFLFILVIWRLLVIANNASDLFGALIVVGVLAHISLQVILNIAVVTNVVPNTGISLPFISYGGSAVLVLLCEIGLVLGVARDVRF